MTFSSCNLTWLPKAGFHPFSDPPLKVSVVSLELADFLHVTLKAMVIKEKELKIFKRQSEHPRYVHAWSSAWSRARSRQSGIRDLSHMSDEGLIPRT
jgi:hypothetical protein